MSGSEKDLKVWNKINALDFEKVKDKLAKKKSLWWRFRTNLDTLEKEYKQFLYLVAIYPSQMVIPWSQKLDDFWHEHILDTKKYNEDCDKIFGKYLHHDPHVPQGTSKHDVAFAKTRLMYKQAFGQKAKAQAKGTSGSSSTSSSCGAGCGTMMPVVFCDTTTSHGSESGNGGGGDVGGCGGGTSCGSSCGGGGCGGGGD